MSYSLLFSIKIKASSIVISLGSFSSGIVAFSDVGGSVPVSIKLADGENHDDNQLTGSDAGGNYQSKRYSATTGYGLFVDKDAVDIDLHSLADRSEF